MSVLRSFVLAASVLGLFACSQEEGGDPAAEPTGGDEAAIVSSSCSPAAYNRALPRYKKAVALAKEHARDACGSDDAYLMNIAREAAAATTECGAFATVIALSPWAAPIRKELAGNLVLSQLTGKLSTKDYAGLEAALASGVTLWGPAPGVYGNMSKIEFAANGKAKFWTLDVDGNEPKWTSKDGTYRVGTLEGDSVLMTVSAGGISTDYEIEAVMRDGTPDFELVPLGDGEGDSFQVFTAYVSECEA